MSIFEIVNTLLLKPLELVFEVVYRSREPMQGT